jgi:selenide,water dikinase
LLCGLPLRRDPRILVGLEDADDAGVFQIAPGLALIQTVDMITPVVDDPCSFGQIAAANAMSDVYAMGGRPITVLSLVCAPVGDVEQKMLREILKGALEKIHEAGAFLVGGHSVEDLEWKIGFAVTGLVSPERIWTKAGAKIGDALILTKALGTGIVATALKGGLAKTEHVNGMVRSMVLLNRRAMEVLQEFPVHAVTDVTGFGLVGHSLEVAGRSSVGIVLHADRIPLLGGVREYVSRGLVPGGTRRNKAFYRKSLANAEEHSGEKLDILFDPQTSGGLLLTVEEAAADSVVLVHRDAGYSEACVIGRVVEDPQARLTILS